MPTPGTLSGNREALDGGNSSTPLDLEGEKTVLEITDKTKEMEEDVDIFLQECDWLENLSKDPYYRGLQDKVSQQFS